MSTLRVSTIQDTAGSNSSTPAAIANGIAKAWVNFNGTGTVAIRAQYNVSSITDNGTGDYTVNLTAAMVDANYAVTGIPEYTNTRPDPTICIAPSGRQTGSVRINVGMSNGLYMDTNTVCVVIFR